MLKGKWITRLAWMAALAAAWTGREARAYLAISGDLETLVNRGSVIVEATVAGGPAGALEVRVTRVLRGEVKSGDVL